MEFCLGRNLIVRELVSYKLTINSERCFLFPVVLVAEPANGRLANE